MRSINPDVSRDLKNPEPMLVADEELIGWIVAGKREYFSVLVERYQKMVFGMIMRQVGSRDVADEIAQETFLRAYKNLETFRRESKFATWLIRIALNQTSNYFSSKRFRQSKQTVSLDMKRHDLPDENISRNDHREALFLSALGVLAPKFRDVLTLCGYEGKSYEEAALILEIPIGTVRSRLNRARLMLKEEIAKIEGRPT